MSGKMNVSVDTRVKANIIILRQIACGLQALMLMNPLRI